MSKTHQDALNLLENGEVSIDKLREKNVWAADQLKKNALDKGNLLIIEEDVLHYYCGKRHTLISSMYANLFLPELTSTSQIDKSFNEAQQKDNEKKLLKIGVDISKLLNRNIFFLIDLGLIAKITDLKNNLAVIDYQGIQIGPAVIPQSISVKIGEPIVFHLGYIATKITEEYKQLANELLAFQLNHPQISKAITIIKEKNNAKIDLRNLCPRKIKGLNLTNKQLENFYKR